MTVPVFIAAARAPVLNWLGILLMAPAALAVAAVLVLHPLWVFVMSRLPRRAGPARGPSPDSLSLVIVARGAAWLEAKAENCAALRYPCRHYDWIVWTDGPDPAAERILQSPHRPRLVMGSTARRVGKNAVLNAAVRRATGEILVFSDVDGLLHEDALVHLLSAFGDPRVGGVCGRRVIGADGSRLAPPQRGYVRCDSAIKAMESVRGSITSNDGKLYAIRRRLFQPVPDGVTDDLYNCLSVVEQGYRFVYEPRAAVTVPTPSRNLRHEATRRRRIVCRSLTGLFRRPALLNPCRHGAYALRLLINKVFRRLLPAACAAFCAGTAALAVAWPAARILLLVEAAGMLLAAGCRWAAARGGPAGPAGRPVLLVAYFTAGAWGTALGLADAVRGRRYTVWEPVKGDGHDGAPAIDGVRLAQNTPATH